MSKEKFYHTARWNKILPGGSVAAVGCIILLCYLLLCWIYKLDSLPGLHGDEAWAGLRANGYLNDGVHGLLGMNNYSGILQPLCAAVGFKIGGIGVAQLRCCGVFFNSIAVIAVFSVFNDVRRFWFFLIIICQSSLYLLSPRIAWEVNSFTLFFIVMAVICVQKGLKTKGMVQKFFYITFLIINILGAYNHIILSCLSVAAFIGLALWALYEKNNIYTGLLVLFAFNLFNVTCIFLLMRYGSEGSNPYYFLLMIVLPFMEIGFVRSFSVNVIVPGFVRYCVIALITVSPMFFLCYHGLAFFETCSAYKMIEQVYAFTVSPYLKVVFILSAAIYLFYLVWFIIRDIRTGGIGSIAAFMIVCYLGLFSFYTINNSLRYYLAVYAVTAIYIVARIRIRSVRDNLIFCILLVPLIGNACMMLHIYSVQNRRFDNTEVKIGRNLIENPGHFFPKEPLINFLRKNHAGAIVPLGDAYFIEKPIMFYKIFEPWTENPRNEVIIDYGDNGYLFLLKERQDVTNPGQK